MINIGKNQHRPGCPAGRLVDHATGDKSLNAGGIREAGRIQSFCKFSSFAERLVESGATL
ncbi:MAG: hypothetical protein DWQ42_10700 [Planctomycetota bacterium]|nr:MAG: hypothetical protein DWQ42_10700 [Planctomycetota bacterium]REK46539.1 MAG: hypothetical protein DWQ46_06605 [Planctomycetota bacterium]